MTLSLVVCLGLAACSGGSAATSDQHSSQHSGTTLKPGSVSIKVAGMTEPIPEPAGATKPKAGRLIAPHVDLAESWSAVGTTMAKVVPVNAGSTGVELTAPAGSEIVAAELVNNTGRLLSYRDISTTGSAGTPRVSVVVDRTATAVDAKAVTVSGSRIAVQVVVPAKRPVLLQVVDAGKTTRLDLRTGDRLTGGDEALFDAFYPRPRSIDKLPTARLTATRSLRGSGGAAVKVVAAATLDNTAMAVQPWVGTWAAPGKAWLVLRGFTSTTSFSGSDPSLSCLAVKPVLRLAAYQLTVAGHPVVPTTGKVDNLFATAVLVFAVPTSFTVGKLALKVDAALAGGCSFAGAGSTAATTLHFG